MQRASVNGKLSPVNTEIEITDQYAGHFLKISYIQEISRRQVYSKDRVDVEPTGDFHFLISAKELLVDEAVTLEVYAPDGELLWNQRYSFDALKPDNETELIIEVAPKIITFEESSPFKDVYCKISGKLIDISGEHNPAAGLQIIIMAVINGSATEEGNEKFQAVFSAQTDRNGFFFGRVRNQTYLQAHALIAGLDKQTVAIELENYQFPTEIILATDLSALLPEYICNAGSIPKLPDQAELINNPSFSQDIGGKCVDFTTPNRTLEEFSFYHTVRTTEPEIRGLTITGLETKRLKTDFLTISDGLFTMFGRINSSMSTLNLVPYTVDEDDAEIPLTATQPLTEHAPTMLNINNVTNIASGNAVAVANPVYKLKVKAGAGMLKFSTKQLHFDFTAILKLLAEQASRKAKLQELHYELAAAFCGKEGAPQVKTYCETLIAHDSLTRATVESLLGHIKEYIDEGNEGLFRNRTVPRQLLIYVQDVQDMMQKTYLDAASIGLIQTRAEKLIEVVDRQTVEGQDQEELLGYLRRLVIELAQASENGSYNFEPCPTRKTQTMGIMCMLHEFEDARDTLRNKSIFSLDEILTVRESYDKYIISISSFLHLLEKFHSFYNAGSNFLISLEDDYFVKNHDAIRADLMAFKRQIYTAINRIEAIERAYISNHPGRRELTVENSIDWDETPTIYENTTIAHGHILHFKQQWKADGYSLGDLLYSLPLAPCQEKQIAIVDWDREERGVRTEDQTSADSLSANLSRNRDISEIINSSFSESIHAVSTNKTSSTSGGAGLGLGGSYGGFSLGLSGGVSHSGASSRSTTDQQSFRNLSGSTLNRLQDNISQAASSLRTQRSTVIQTVGQNETVSVQTEVVKNNNHCHAVTIEYFEVLRHYAIEQNLVDVQECLFVPLPMSLFDYAKILRWKDTLRRVVYGTKLRRGFDAIERISNDYADSDLPKTIYADEKIFDFTGNFTISFDLQRPQIPDPEIDEATKTEKYNLKLYFGWFSRHYMLIPMEREVPLTEAEKDALFEAEYAPEIVREFIDTIDVYGIDEYGNEVLLNLDLTMISNYKNAVYSKTMNSTQEYVNISNSMRGVPLQVSIAASSPPTITRRQIKYLRVRAKTSVHISSRIILHSFYLHYRTKHLDEAIIRNSSLNNDIINSVKDGGELKTDAALMYAPLSDKELRNPMQEDRESAAALVSFLNEHLEMAHKAIWLSMDSSRLFGLLDGYIAPNSKGKSVASVVENKIMGIVGNNLVLKVVPGERLDPVFRHVKDLVTFYQPTTKPDPFRISVPTKGVYAESVMGKCNSCEEIDETKHWRFDDVPCGTKPTAIDSVSTESRRTDTDNLQVKDLPSSIINMQNAPSAPDPTGLGAAFNLLGKSDVFKDMTGLAGTQANALEALKTTSKSVTDLAGMAADLQKQGAMKKDIGKTLKTIQEAEGNKQISKDQANKLAYSALSSMVGEPTVKQPNATSTNEVKDLTKTAGDNKASLKVSRPSGEQIEVDARDTTTNTVSISLTAASSSAENRAFNPSSLDKTGIIELEAIVNNPPVGTTYKWVPDNAAAINIISPTASKTIVYGKIPGKTGMRFEVYDGSGTLLANHRVELSVPQFVTIDEEKATFDPVLQRLKIDTLKDSVISVAKEVCDMLLRKANVRTIWRLGSFNETVLSHLPAANVTKATFRGDPPSSNLLGITHGPGGSAVLNETIDIYPGGYDDPIPVGTTNIDIDIETQALIIQMESINMTDPDLEKFAIKVFGRLFGETLAHEIVHSLLWTVIPSGHNSPSVANDLMNNGYDRSFTQRTGIEDTSHTDPVEPDNFIDHGINTIGGLQAINQARIDSVFPVPPAFS